MWDRPNGAGNDWEPNVRVYLTTTLPTALTEALLKKGSAGSFTVLPLDSVRARLETAKATPNADARRVLPDDVKALLTGNLANTGQLTVQLVDAASGHLLWSKTYPLALNVDFLNSRLTFGIPDRDRDKITNEVFGKLKR
jgi:hypothetical protein